MSTPRLRSVLAATVCLFAAGCYGEDENVPLETSSETGSH